MTMTKRQNRLYEAGRALRNAYPAHTFHNALAVASQEYYSIDELEDLTGYADAVFFEAGFNEFAPQWVEAYRFGAIPAGGRSTNWAEGTMERGVSCVCLADSRSADEMSVYDVIYGVQSIDKIKIAGWYLGMSGSDGEPLLHEAVNC